MKNATKSLTALLLALIMSLTLLPAEVLAAEDDAAETASCTAVYVNPTYAGIARNASGVSVQAAPAIQTAVAAQAETVYTDVKSAAAALRKEMIAHSERMTVSVRLAGTTGSEKNALAVSSSIWTEALAHVTGNGAAGDCLRWQHAGTQSAISYTRGADPTYTITYTSNPESSGTIWYTTAEQERQLNSYIKSTILPQLALDGKTTYQKVKAIYDWMTKNIKYDYTNLDDGSYMLKYTAYAAAINKKAVCQGYANLFYRLANDAGIDCRIITGQGDGDRGWEAHSWNIVKLDDGKYYCLDATWGAAVKDSARYFLKGTATFNTDHRVSTETTPYWTDYAAKVSAADYTVKASDTAVVVGKVTLGKAAGNADGITVTWQKAANAAKYYVYRKDAKNTGWKKLAEVSGTSYTDKTAEYGVQYTYTVKGIAADGKTAGKYDSAGVSAMRAPAKVKLSKATGNADSITVTWTKTDGASKYYVYRKDTKNTEWQRLAEVSGTSYTDKTAAHGVRYTYTVKGVAADGTKGAHDSTGVSAMRAPAKVKLGKATGSADGITVTWTKAEGAAKYYVYRKDAKNTGWKNLATVTSGTSYTDKTAAHGVQYTYTVKAIAADGKTAGKYDSAGVSAMRAPAAVKLGKAAAGTADITVTWSKADGAVKYNVYRRTSDSSWKKLATVNGSTLKYVDKTASRGVQYIYTVRGIAADGTTMGTYDKAGVSDTIAPVKVTLDKISANASGVTVTWKAANGAAKYYVYRKDAKNTSWKRLGTVSSGTSYTDKTAEYGVQYTYTVKGVAADGTKGAHDTTGLTVMMVPATVTLNNATHNATSITVTWKAAAGAKTYHVYRRAPGDSSWTIVGRSVSGTSYTDKNVKVGVKYTYTVRGIASDGKTLSAKYNASGVSDTLPKVTPAKVELMTPGTDAAGITVKWKKAANAAKYYVYRKTADSSWKKIATVSDTGASSYSYKDTSVTKGVSYTYTVRGLSTDGQTLGSYDAAGKTAKVTASSSATPAYVTMKSAKRITSGTKGIQLTWASANNAKTYNVYRFANPPTDKNGNPTAVTSGWKLVGKQVNGLSFKDTTGQSGVTYAYTVRGVAADGKTLSASYNTVGLRITMP